MIAAKVEIKGMDDVLRTLNTGPKEMRAVARKSMTKAAKVTSKEMTHKTPERWRLLAGYRVSIGRRTGRIQARMGYYNSKKAKGKQPKGADHAFDWFKAYWGNYGTLDFRDPKHVFKYPIKPRRYAAARRRLKWVKGQKAQHWYEAAINGWENTFLAAFRTAFDTNFEKAFGK